MKKQKVFSLIVTGVVASAAVFVVLFFGGTVGYQSSYWVGFAFFAFAFLVLFVIEAILFKSGKILQDWFFHYPLIRHTILYFAIGLIMSIASMVCSALGLLAERIMLPVSLLVQSLVFCVYAVLAASCFIAKQTAQTVREERVLQSTVMKRLAADSRCLAEKCQDAPLKTMYDEFAEAVELSDPMSVEECREIEQELTEGVERACRLIEDDESEEAQRLCVLLMEKLRERNVKTKAFK